MNKKTTVGWVEHSDTHRLRICGVHRLRSTHSAHFEKGFTLLELIVVIVIIMVMMGLFLNRMPFYQEQAEKAAMEQVSGALQSALVLRFSALMVRGGAERDISVLATDNPVNWLQQKPRNYAGEFYDPSPRAVAPGQWMFDLKSRDLIYVVNHGDYFTPGKDGKKWIRFHSRLVYDPVAGEAASGRQEVAAALFEPTEPYHWFD